MGNAVMKERPQSRAEPYIPNYRYIFSIGGEDSPDTDRQDYSSVCAAAVRGWVFEGATMVSLRERRGKASVRGKQLWAAAMCAASFLAGAILLGEDLEPASGSREQGTGSRNSASARRTWNQYLQAKSRAAGEIAAGVLKKDAADVQPSKTPSQAAAPAVGEVGGAAQPTAGADSAGQEGASQNMAGTPAPAEPNSLRPATVEAVHEVPLIEARPLPVKLPVAMKPAKEPDPEKPTTATPAPAAQEEHLAPIVPAWAIVKASGSRESGVRTRQTEMTSDQAQRSSGAMPVAKPIQSSRGAPKPQMQNPPAEPLRIELGQPNARRNLRPIAADAASAASDRGLPDKSQPLRPGPFSERQASHTAIAVHHAVAAEMGTATVENQMLFAPRHMGGSPTAPLVIVNHTLRPQQEERPLSASRPAARAEAGAGALPERLPLEKIQESCQLKLCLRRSLKLRTKVDVCRTAIDDRSICDVLQTTSRELSIVARAVGATHVTFWFDDPAIAPLSYLVEVLPMPGPAHPAEPEVVTQETGTAAVPASTGGPSGRN
jgi:hypothetical protein